jgi:hypothetical protein
VALYVSQQYIIVFTAVCNSEAMRNILWHAGFYFDDVLAQNNFQGGGKPLISSPLLLVPYIRSTLRVKVTFFCARHDGIYSEQR